MPKKIASKDVISKALMRDSRTSKVQKLSAGSALSQRKNKK